MTLNVKTFKLTISVKEDISDECVSSVMKYLTKICSHLFAVCEYGEGDRKHFHAAILFKTAPAQLKKWKSVFYKERVRPHHPDSIARVAVTCITMYNHGWYDEYLRKEDKSQVILDTYDRDAFEAAFPTPETQSALQEKSRANATPDPIYKLLVRWFREDYPAATVTTKGQWCVFVNKCFVMDRIDYRDERTLLELKKKSFMYLTKDYRHLSDSDKKWCGCDKKNYELYLSEGEDEEDPDAEA